MHNIVDKRCEYINCTVWPVYGYEKGIPKYCKSHKQRDMNNVVDKLCEVLNCNTRSYYNYQGQTKGIYCNAHKLQDMVDVKNKVCATHLCGVYIERKYTYCLRCAIYMGDMSDWVTLFWWKEHIIWDYIQ